MKKLLILLFINFLLITSVQAKNMRFVQITDARFCESNSEILHKVINDVNQQKNISFVVFTGDNIKNANPNTLCEFLKEVKRLKMPYYIVIGDKDVNKHNDLSKKQYTKILKKKIKHYKPDLTNYCFEKNGIMFFVADGAKDVIPGTNGYYKDNVIEWLDANIDLYPKHNIIIFQHFPLIPPIEKESYYTFKPEIYLNMLEKHKNVKAVISGHYGVNSEKDINGVKHITTAPIPCYRIFDISNTESDTPDIWAQIKVVE